MKTGLVRILVVLASAAGGSAQAADWYTGEPGARAESPLVYGVSSNGTTGYVAPAYGNSSYASTSNFGVAVDGSLTADTKNSVFGTVIGTIAPFGSFEQSGARIRLAGVLGQYSYIGSNSIGRVTGTQMDGSFMVGYEWVSRRATVAVYGGGNIVNNKLSVYDPSNSSAGQATGFKIGADFYIRPTDFIMISGVGSYSSAHNAYYAKLKTGLAIAPDIFVGPEAVFLGDSFFTQWRAGMHITGAKFSALQIGASAGILKDKVRGSGIYGALDARIKF